MNFNVQNVGNKAIFPAYDTETATTTDLLANMTHSSLGLLPSWLEIYHISKVHISPDERPNETNYSIPLFSKTDYDTKVLV